MLLHPSRRHFLRLLELLGVIGLGPNVAPAMALLQTGGKPGVPPSGSAPPNPGATSDDANDTANLNSEALKRMADFIQDALRAAEAASQANSPGGASISPEYGHPQPYVPTDDPETELEGATREDFPIDYKKFDPDTGLFGDSSEAD
jgi:hypothetical protein